MFSLFSDSKVEMVCGEFVYLSDSKVEMVCGVFFCFSDSKNWGNGNQARNIRILGRGMGKVVLALASSAFRHTIRRVATPAQAFRFPIPLPPGPLLPTRFLPHHAEHSRGGWRKPAAPCKYQQDEQAQAQKLLLLVGGRADHIGRQSRRQDAWALAERHYQEKKRRAHGICTVVTSAW